MNKSDFHRYALRQESRPRGRAVRLPLADVRVIAIEQYGAGPWATLQLADLGAEIIKVEDPASKGDVGRYVPPFQEGEDSLFFETFNRNKQSVSLDLRHPRGREVFEDLVRNADCVFSNLRGDQPDRLRLTYDDLKDVKPRIVCCSLSGFGMSGPRRAEAGYDYIMQSMAGWMSFTGEPDGPPTKSGLSLVDLSGGYVAAIAMLSGLWRARREGVGCDCDVSLFETALHELMYIGTWAATMGYEPRRMPDSAHPSIVPFQAFETADGWIVVACAKQKFWEQLCRAIDREDLLGDERFADFAGRDRHRDELLPILSQEFKARTEAQWLELLARVGVPHGRVNNVHTALADRQTAARGAVVEIEHPRFGSVRQVASPLRVADYEDGRALERAPFRGEHTERVLAELCGYEQDQIAELRDGGAFGDPPPRALAAADGGAATRGKRG
jgi:crotonobetainyl-CoA:carnitine CoA-transferase CaiB-like acyl-CoA transferase